MLISSGASHAGSVNVDDDDLDMDDETRRELTITLLRLLYAQTQSSLQQIKEEAQILQNMPSPSSSHSQPETSKRNDDTWRLDTTPRGGPDGRGPLMDSQGRPLRPFTILPSNVAERTRLQNEVFRPDHRLPSMSIDEYLAEEERRGNILRGGGHRKASEQAPTSSEQLAVDSEQDGTRFGEEKSEEKRKKDEEWAVFTDANPKGAGNTMNRGQSKPILTLNLVAFKMVSSISPTLLPAPQIFPFLLPKPHQPHATPIPRNGQVKFNERRDLKEEADVLSDEELEIEELMAEIKTYGHNFLIPIGKNMTLDEESAADPSEPGSSDSNSQTQSASQAEELGTDLDADMQDLDAEVQDLDASTQDLDTSAQDLDASVQDLDASIQDLDADIPNEDSEASIATDQSFVDDEQVDQDYIMDASHIHVIASLDKTDLAGHFIVLSYMSLFEPTGLLGGEQSGGSNFVSNGLLFEPTGPGASVGLSLNNNYIGHHVFIRDFSGHSFSLPKRKKPARTTSANMRTPRDLENLLETPTHRMMEQLSLSAANDESSQKASGKSGTSDGGVNHSMWVDRYRPKCFTDLLGDERVHRETMAWLKEWDQCVFGRRKRRPLRQEANEGPQYQDEHGRPREKILLLSGPPGLGKTTLAHIVGKQAGYGVAEINASDARTGSIVDDRIRPILESGTAMGSNKPVLMVIDEVDGATGDSVSFVRLGYELKARGDKGGKDSRPLLRPIICICNDLYAPSLARLRPIARVIRFRKAQPVLLTNRLRDICTEESLRADTRALTALVTVTQGDMRACINTLQNDINRATAGMKETESSVQSVWNDLFTPVTAKTRKHISGASAMETDKYVSRLSRVIDNAGTDRVAVGKGRSSWDSLLAHFTRTRVNEEIKTTVSNSLTTGARDSDAAAHLHMMSGSKAVLEFLPLVNRIINPPLKPLNSQIVRTQERLILKRLVEIMAALELRYIQDKNEDGQPIYRLEPCVKCRCRLAADMNPSRFAVRQMVAEELDALIDRRRHDATTVTSAANGLNFGSRKPKATSATDQDANEAAQTIKEKKTPLGEKQPLDFFGRPIVPKDKPSATSGSRKPSSTIAVNKTTLSGCKVKYKYNEGNSSAVRKPSYCETIESHGHSRMFANPSDFVELVSVSQLMEVGMLRSEFPISETNLSLGDRSHVAFPHSHTPTVLRGKAHLPRMNIMETLFGRSVTPAERLRQHQRALAKAQRELDRERTKLEQQEKKLIMDIKKSAKMIHRTADLTTYLERRKNNGQRPCPYSTLCTEILSDEDPTSGGRAADPDPAQQPTNGRSDAWCNTGNMNRGLNLPQIQRIMTEFEKESATMDMKEEMMSDAVDDVMDDELEDEEEEGDKILNQVLDEIGVGLQQDVSLQLPPTALGTTASQLPNQRQMVAIGEGADGPDSHKPPTSGEGGPGNSDEDALQARLDALKKGF
ncbi:sister chromatid cohesion-related protein [Rhizoctonia solani AG-1 IA]|uniref:Sister chromatid cohesion-related protein n=1 Tax=Thanatephorus cucumeris (strain AG1-IA) TaxID=983506 RepID=L8WEL6_THACA|nr:sister chromatid cohesion-related protein [Rhizoctonia solani AG-1 IA]